MYGVKPQANILRLMSEKNSKDVGYEISTYSFDSVLLCDISTTDMSTYLQSLQYQKLK
jgi:hypothetical protein